MTQPAVSVHKNYGDRSLQPSPPTPLQLGLSRYLDKDRMCAHDGGVGHDVEKYF